MTRRWHSQGVRRTHLHGVLIKKVEEKVMSSDENTQPVEPNVDQTDAFEALGDDVFDFEMPDIPMPDEEIKEMVVEDKFKSACKLAFLGIGRAGSRLAETFHKVGYGRVCVVNTAQQDLAEIKMPDERKLWLGAQGAGGVRKAGAKYVKDYYEDVVDLMRRSFGSEFDRIIICVGAGGGTGSGGVEVAVEIASAFAEHMKITKPGDKTKVGVMVALPTNSERSNMNNAYEAMKFVEKQLEAEALSPVIIIDNESVSRLYPGATVGNVWVKINQSAVTLLHTFNAICVAPTQHIALDPADLETILEAGLITYGATQLKDVSSDGLSRAMTHTIKNNVLCSGFDMNTAKSCGCVIAGEAAVLNSLNAQDIDQNCFEKIERITGGASVHRGIYTTKKPLAAYAMFGGLDLPTERLDEVARLAGKSGWKE